MPLPKKKYSKARAGKRRAHLGLTYRRLIECSHCHAMRPPHRVCPHCGYYAGRQIVKTENE